MTPEQRFGQTVRQSRLALGMSQERLADEIGKRGVRVHQTVIHKVENGIRAIRLNEAVAIADVLHITLSGLLQNQADEAQVDRMARLERALWQVSAIAAEARS